MYVGAVVTTWGGAGCVWGAVETPWGDMKVLGGGRCGGCLCETADSGQGEFRGSLCMWQRKLWGFFGWDREIWVEGAVECGAKGAGSVYSRRTLWGDLGDLGQGAVWGPSCVALVLSR